MADERPPLPADVPPPRQEGIAGGPPGSAPPPIVPGAITSQPMAMPPIPLEPPPKSAATPDVPSKEVEHKDTFRELIETVVFVVVLVLMLKTFLAEAFVIPTGSMATTLLGYHHKISCRECGKPLLINASDEADPQGRDARPVFSCECENCGAINHLEPPPPVLVQRGGQP